jgi:hypothetical protein
VVVGGGAPLCGDRLRGASAVVRPQHAAVANAVGAAIAQVGGFVDAVFDMGSTAASRAAVLAQAEQQAVQRAVQAGAVPGSCWVAVREEVPLAYLPGTASRVRIKVIGDLDLATLGRCVGGSSGSGPAGGSQCTVDGMPAPAPTPTPAEIAERAGSAASGGREAEAGWPPLAGRGEEPTPAELAAWQPEVNEQGEWVIQGADLHLIATGAGMLGCGGGGSPGKALLKALMQLQR